MSTSLQEINQALAEFAQSYYNEQGIRIESVDIEWIAIHGKGDRVDNIAISTGCSIKEIE